MKTKHTQGKWEVFENTVLCGWKHLAKIIKQDLSKEEFEANAKLIAAAPELLQVAENALKLLDKLSKYDTEFKGQIAGNICDLNRTIKKATE